MLALGRKPKTAGRQALAETFVLCVMFRRVHSRLVTIAQGRPVSIFGIILS
jgi:hypothetical protein